MWTPANDYERQRLEIESALNSAAPRGLAFRLCKLLRPAINVAALPTKDENIRTGASKLGGMPDLPDSTTMPGDKPMAFVAQFDMREVAPFDIEKVLPKDGVLSFFHSVDGSEDHAILLVPNRGLTRVPEPPPTEIPHGLLGRMAALFSGSGDDLPPLPPASVRFQASWRLPEAEAPEYLAYFDDGERVEIKRLLKERCRSLCGFGTHLLGYPRTAMANAQFCAVKDRKTSREEAQRLALEWRLLFQVTDWMESGAFGENGSYSFLLRETDLRAGNWTNSFGDWSFEA